MWAELNSRLKIKILVPFNMIVVILYPSLENSTTGIAILIKVHDIALLWLKEFYVHWNVHKNQSHFKVTPNVLSSPFRFWNGRYLKLCKMRPSYDPCSFNFIVIFNQFSISWLSAMSADAILKITIKLKELKIAQLRL